MIERHIHFVWIGNTLPESFAQNVEAFRVLNPTYKVTIHDESVLLPELKAAFEQCDRLDSKSDLLRLSALYRFGGWYFDTDFYPLRSMDDMSRAWGLSTGNFKKIFIAKQQHHASGSLPFGNAVLGCEKESAAMKRLITDASNVDSEDRVAYGPRLLTEAVTGRRSDFLKVDACWFYPLDKREARAWYAMVNQGRVNTAVLMDRCKGQLPYMVHLWAGGQPIEIQEPYRGGKVATFIFNRAKDITKCFDNPVTCCEAGMKKLGYETRWHETKHPDDMTMPAGSCPDIVFMWNGRREPHRTLARYYDSIGIPVVRLEHGWFDRKQFSHIDNQDILHWASWAHEMSEPASKDAFDRFALVHPGASDVRRRSNGYVLCLGQCTGDTQLESSDFNGGKNFEKACHIACYNLGLEAEFRPHPLSEAFYNRRSKWMKKNDSESLEAAVAGARFVVTMNSNAGNEALAMGCPVLTLGPSLSGIAGLTMDVGKAGLERGIEAMADGYCPDPEEVRNFLAQLAAHQYSRDELREGFPLVPFIEAA